MKTKSVLATMVITVCMFATVVASAQEEPAIKIYESGDLLKVVFGYDSKSSVIIDFEDQTGTFSTDKVDAANFGKGFIRRYDVKRENGDAYWVNVKNDLVSARFKITTERGRLTSKLETVTYNNPIAKR